VLKYEVELKAWVDDPAAIETRLREKFRCECRFAKEDMYFRAAVPFGGIREEFRLRVEHRSPGGPAGWFSDGGAPSGEPRAVVTWKAKSRSGGIEVNEEHEFAVSDPAAFRALAERLGCTAFFRKAKRGLKFVDRDTVLELEEVEGLGTFIEIETLAPDDAPDTIAAASARIRNLLRELGVSEDRIEARYFIDLLSGKET
jgi:adenylate cyclase class 2